MASYCGSVPNLGSSSSHQQAVSTESAVNVVRVAEEENKEEDCSRFFGNNLPVDMYCAFLDCIRLKSKYHTVERSIMQLSRLDGWETT